MERWRERSGENDDCSVRCERRSPRIVGVNIGDKGAREGKEKKGENGGERTEGRRRQG